MYGAPACDADVVDGQDVRVIQLPGGARLLLEAMHAARIGRERLGDQLDRDVAPEAWIARAVDLAHAAGAEPADDLIRTDAGTGRDVMGTPRIIARAARASPSIPGCAHVEGHEQRPDADGVAIGELDRRGDALARRESVPFLLPKSSSTVPSAVTTSRA